MEIDIKVLYDLIDIIKSKQLQCETKWQCGYQKALNDILGEINKLKINGNINPEKL